MIPASRYRLSEALDSLGVKQQGNARYYRHPKSEFALEFPNRPTAGFNPSPQKLSDAAILRDGASGGIFATLGSFAWLLLCFAEHLE